MSADYPPLSAARRVRLSGSWRPAPSNARHACGFRRASPWPPRARAGAASVACRWTHAGSAGRPGRDDGPLSMRRWDAAVAGMRARAWLIVGSGVRRRGWPGAASPRPCEPAEAIRMPQLRHPVSPGTRGGRVPVLPVLSADARSERTGPVRTTGAVRRIRWRASTNRPGRACGVEVQSRQSLPGQARQGVWAHGMQFASVSVRRDRATRGDRHDSRQSFWHPHQGA